jgi:hypothetical protein
MAASNKSRIKFGDFYKTPLVLFKISGLDLEEEVKNKKQVPRSSREKWISCLYRFYYYLLLVNLFLCQLFLITHAILNRSDPPVLFATLPAVNNVSAINFVFIVVISSRENIIEILESLKVFYEENEKTQIYHKQLMRPKKIYGALMALMITALVFNIAIGYVLNQEQKYMVEIWLPFDCKSNDHCFLFAQLWTVWLVSASVAITYSCDWILYSIVTILSMQFDEFGCRLLTELNDENVSYEKLKQLAKHHDKLMKISDKISSTFSLFILFYFCICSLIICLTEFQILMARSVAELTISIPVLAIGFVKIFLLCLYGQKLTDSSQKVSKIIYESSWMNIKEKRVRKVLPFMMKAAHKAKTLKGYGFVVISYESFTAVS